MIDRSNPIPLYIQLKEELTKLILDGKWEINSQFYTEQELMKIYGVGRATVREAINLMVNQGYLCKNQGVGTFVIRNKPSFGFEPLMSLTYTLKTKGVRGSNKILSKEIFEPSKEMMDKMKWNKPQKALFLKRLRLVEDVPIALENSYFTEEFSSPQLDEAYKGSITNIIINKLNIKIAKIDQTITLGYPTKEEQEILNIAENTQVVYLDRWIYSDEKEEPFYYLKFVVPENLYFIPIESL